MKMNVLSVLKFFMIYVITDKRGEYKFIVKGREVEASFTEEPNPDIVPQLKTILLGDANPPAYKRAKREPKEERTWNIDMDRVRSATPAEEALRHDDKFAYAAVWEYKGMDVEPELTKEDLVYEFTHRAQRNYKD